MARLSFKIRQEYVGQLIENTLHVEGNSIGALDALPIAQYIRDEWELQLGSFLSTQYSMNEIVYRLEPATAGTPYRNLPVTGLPWSGTNALQFTPAFATLTVAFQSVDGPPFRGYNALGGFAGTTVQSNGNWGGSLVTAADTLFENIDNHLASAYNGASLVIVSKNSLTVPSGTTANVTNVAAREVIGIRSSRKVGRGS